jgi:hypothetical protein
MLNFHFPLRLTVLAAICVAASGMHGADALPGPAPAYPPYELPNTVCRVLPKTAADRTYELYIGLPASYGKSPKQKYPVILVTDGYWSFPGANAAAGGLAYGKRIPESLVVGLSYAGDNLDYGTLRVMDLAIGTVHGIYDGEEHAERYLDVIEKQVLPLLESEYQADPEHRYIVGSSAGGQFVLYAMMAKPNLFQGYVADSPSVNDLWNMDRAFAASGQTVAGRLFMTSAEYEWPAYRRWIPRFYERIKQHGYVKGGLVYRETLGVRHSVGLTESYMRGLMYVMEPLAPELGVDTERAPAPARNSFVINFWISTKGSASRPDASVRAAHQAYLEKVAAEKQASFVFDWEQIPDSGGTLFVNAASKTEAEAIAREDPEVQKGMFEFEVLGD